MFVTFSITRPGLGRNVTKNHHKNVFMHMGLWHSFIIHMLPIQYGNKNPYHGVFRYLPVGLVRGFSARNCLILLNIPGISIALYEQYVVCMQQIPSQSRVNMLRSPENQLKKS